jgi:hypothetical protein
MSEYTEPEALSERLRRAEGRLAGVQEFVVRSWEREERRARRRYLTAGLVRVHASRDDLESAGVDATAVRTIFSIQPSEFELGDPRDDDALEGRLLTPWLYETLWEIEGDGWGGCYGYYRGWNLEDRVKNTCYYLPAEQAAKVNAIRAKKYLDDGGMLHGAEQMEGGSRFDRNFVAAVRAEVKSHDAPGHAEEYKKLCERLDTVSEHLEAMPGQPIFEFMAAMQLAAGVSGLTYMRSKLAGVTAFLVVAALGTIAADLRTGLAFGLAAWAVVALVWWKLRKNILRVMNQAVEDAGRAAGHRGGVVEDALSLVYRQMVGVTVSGVRRPPL